MSENEADGSTSNMSETDSTTVMAGILQGLQASITQLTRASVSQTEAFQSLKEDLLLQPEPVDYNSDEEDENHNTVDPTATVNELLDSSKGTTGPKSADGKKQSDLAESDIIDSLTQALMSNVKKSPAIDGKIASLVDNILIGDLSEKMAKEKGEKYPPPENCKHLQAITVNEEIWDLMSRRNRSVDLAFQRVQEPLVEGLSALTILADRLVKDIQSSKTTNTREILDHVIDSVAILGNANWKLNMKRREVIKPDLNPPYTRLCKEDIKPSQKLFGDDLSKHLKEMTDAKRAGQQMQKNTQSGKSYKQRGHRSKPYDRPSTSSVQNWQGNSQRNYKRPFLGYGRASTQTNQKKNNPKNQS